jgi:uncharacterized protein YjiS (DUF1127 family)
MTAISTLSRREALAPANAISSSRTEFLKTLREWLRRSRSRRDLMALNNRELWEMRLTRADALEEANKPFWRE